MGCCNSKVGERRPILSVKDAPLHTEQYISEDFSYDIDHPPVIIPTKGYMTELGCKDLDSIPRDLQLEEQERNNYYYKSNFSNVEHINFVGGTQHEPCVISVQNDKNMIERKVIVRLGKTDLYCNIESGVPRSKILSLLKEIFPELEKLKFKEVSDPNLVKDLVHMEERFVIQNYKFGVIYCKGGQTLETEMFSNEKGSPEFDKFLTLLGDKVKLEGWKGYRGELDVETNTTGTHSVFTKFFNYNVMFHVSTLLPYSSVNNQQLERKSRIGNDVCVIVFQDEGTPFSPTCISSKYNHVYIVVQKEKDKYRIAVTSKRGVRPYGPLLPSDPVFEHNQQLRDFLLTKIINAERASYTSPAFNQVRTRKDWLRGVLEKYNVL